MFLSDILFALWFFLPVGLANCTPIFAAHAPFLKQISYPLDFYTTLRGKRLLGDHKTVRGVITGILVAIVVVYLEKYIYLNSLFVQNLIPITYEKINPFVFGILAGIGALLGDAVKSFFKRQLDIPTGKRWFPFDQLDYIVGGIILTVFYIPLSIKMYGIIIVVWFLLHLGATRIGHLMGLKQSSI